MPPHLSDAFSEEYKKRYAAENFIITAVLRCYCPKANKEKRMIYVGTKYDKEYVALVHINTDINENFAPTEYLKSLHLPFDCAGRDYLTHDCFVNCSQLIIRRRDEVQNLVEKIPSILIGNVSQDDYTAIRNLIKTAKTIIPAHKKEFGLFL
jgi:hypothetical protein